MKVTYPIIDKIAELTKLSFKGEEKEVMKIDMENILSFMNILSKVDTHNVKPLKYVTEGMMDLRTDQPELNITKSQALVNAPSKDSDYFKVPKVLGKSV